MSGGSSDHEGSGWRAFQASATVLVLVVLLSWLLGQGDLLALPAVTLVLLSWLLLVATWLATWLLTALGPPGAAAVRRLGRAAWSGLADQPEAQRTAALGHRVGTWLAPLRPLGRWTGDRLAVTPEGLGRTVPLLVLVAAVAGLVALQHSLGTPGPVTATDQRYADLAAELRTPGILAVMSALSLVARTQGLLVMTGLMVAGALVAGARRAAVMLVATSLLSSTSVTVLKALVSRPRPPVGQIVETSNSWPSGHSSGALALALGVTLLLWAAGRQHWRWVAAAILPVGLLVGFSRAYLTVHWLSDVAAGWLVATAAAALVLLVDGLVRDRLPEWWAATPSRRWPLPIAACLVLLVIAVRWTTGLERSYPSPPAVEVERLAEVDSLVEVLAADPFSRTLLGREMEPATVLLVGERATIDAATTEAGWVTVDEPTPPRLLAAYRDGIDGSAAPTSPVTPAFLAQRIQDLAIAMEEDGADGPQRHRARLWRLPYVIGEGCPVFAAAAALEDELGWNWRTLVPTRHTAAAIDVERDHLARTVADTERFERVGTRQLVEPTFGTNAADDAYFTDGRIVVLTQTSACTADDG